MKKSQVALIGGVGVITGMSIMTAFDNSSNKCSSNNTVSPEAIQQSVDDILYKFNKEDKEIKEFLAEIQELHPEVVGARYGFVDDIRYLFVAVLRDKNNVNGGLSEYAIRLDKTGAKVASTQLARELTVYQSRCRGECDSYSHVTSYASWTNYRVTTYPNREKYKSHLDSQKKSYTMQTAKMSASNRATEIKSKASSSAALSQQRQAFSTKRTTSRSSSMSFSSSRSWGG